MRPRQMFLIIIALYMMCHLVVSPVLWAFSGEGWLVRKAASQSFSLSGTTIIGAVEAAGVSGGLGTWGMIAGTASQLVPWVNIAMTGYALYAVTNSALSAYNSAHSNVVASTSPPTWTHTSSTGGGGVQGSTDYTTASGLPVTVGVVADQFAAVAYVTSNGDHYQGDLGCSGPAASGYPGSYGWDCTKWRFEYGYQAGTPNHEYLGAYPAGVTVTTTTLDLADLFAQLQTALLANDTAALNVLVDALNTMSDAFNDPANPALTKDQRDALAAALKAALPQTFWDSVKPGSNTLPVQNSVAQQAEAVRQGVDASAKDGYSDPGAWTDPANPDLPDKKSLSDEIASRYAAARSSSVLGSLLPHFLPTIAGETSSFELDFSSSGGGASRASSLGGSWGHMGFDFSPYESILDFLGLCIYGVCVVRWGLSVLER